MKHVGHAICALILIPLSTNHTLADALPATRVDLGTRVRSVFAAKCAECHSSQLARPKGKFGYVLDLKQVAANPKIVAPFNPSGSRLWTQIADGDMPPDDAKAGPLADADKRLIRLWIETGAPAPLTEFPPVEAGFSEPESPIRSLPTRLLQLFGKLHVLMIHFPIALLAAAAIAESWLIWKGRWGMSPVVRFCVLLGAGAAVVAAVAGWVHASYGPLGSDTGQTLALHRWLGTAAGVGAVATALACEWDVLQTRRSSLFRAILFFSAALVGAAGHFGGMLVYGSDFFHL
jgi:uncharacterized membrane protein